MLGLRWKLWFLTVTFFYTTGSEVFGLPSPLTTNALPPNKAPINEEIESRVDNPTFTTNKLNEGPRKGDLKINGSGIKRGPLFISSTAAQTTTTTTNSIGYAAGMGLNILGILIF
jgi:hypothetical protein